MISIKSDDNLLIDNLINNLPKLADDQAKEISQKIKNGKERIKKLEFEYPFDKDIVEKLRKIQPLSGSNTLYSKINELKNLWFVLTDKSIKCLRNFDDLEPYLEYEKKKPQSYGIEDLKLYYDEFAGFEALLYGSNQFYRDHVIHLFRTWLLGLNILIKQTNNDFLFNVFEIEGIKKEDFKFNFFECISIWTISALCHDLGYPLEKFQEVISRTQKMMEYLVSRPKIQQDIKFSGTQDKLNEFIVRLISSKMVEVSGEQCKPEKKCYLARIQSKYYIKYSKSLEDYKHGIISAIIIYKALLYFLETDFSIHEHYTFNYNEARQFYLRRDILRSIAAHTCKDIYHMKSNTFPFLLILCDELQEWGRKKWSNIYRNTEGKETGFKLMVYDLNTVSIEYNFSSENTKGVVQLISSFYKQYMKFKKLFRDGQDTANRTFSFYVAYEIKWPKEKRVKVDLLITNKDAASFIVVGESLTPTHFKQIVKQVEGLEEPMEQYDRKSIFR